MRVNTNFNLVARLPATHPLGAIAVLYPGIQAGLFSHSPLDIVQRSLMPFN